MNYIVHDSNDTLFVLVENGSLFFVRARWATDSGLLQTPPVGTITATNYTETPSTWVSQASPSTPVTLSIDPLFWAQVRGQTRNVFVVVEYRFSASDPWSTAASHTFIVNHDPVADAGPTQVVQLDATGMTSADVKLDASNSDDADLHASTNPDAGPLHFRWRLTSTPPGATGFLPQVAAALPDAAQPLVIPRQVTIPSGQRGIYRFGLTVTDNDIATVGRTTGLPGMGTAATRLLVLGGAAVDLYADMFIPEARVALPGIPRSTLGNAVVAHIRGDSRIDASGKAVFVKGGSSRAWTSAVIGMGELQPLLWSAHDTDYEQGYYDLNAPPGQQWRPPLVWKPDTVDMSESAATGIGGSVNVTLDASIWLFGFPRSVPKKPRIFGGMDMPLSCGYGYTVNLLITGDTVAYDVEGTHDPYPSFSLYLGQQLIYSYDSKGHSMLNLVHPPGVGLVDVDVSGTVPLSQAFAPLWRNPIVRGVRRIVVNTFAPEVLPPSQ